MNNCPEAMSGDDIEALLNELDGIDYSPLRPWPASKQLTARQSAKTVPAACNPYGKDVRAADEESNEAHSRRPTVIDHGDVEDEINGLLGDLGKLDTKTEDDPLASSVARRISGDKLSAAFDVGNNGGLLKPSRLCPERVTLGCAEEQGSRPTMEVKFLAAEQQLFALP